MRSGLLGSLLACWVMAACGGNQAPAAGAETDGQSTSAAESTDGGHQPGPVGTQLVRDVTESKETYEVGADEKNGLGGFNVGFEGKALWPPQGEGCDKMVGCCNALVAQQKSHGLMCLLALARDKTCDKATATAVAIVKEQSYPVPAACR